MATSSLLDGNVTDAVGRAVPGALIYVYDADGDLADLADAQGAEIANPVTAGEDGYWQAFVEFRGLYTLRYFWGGRERLVEANRIAGAAFVSGDFDSAAALGARDEAVAARDAVLPAAATATTAATTATTARDAVLAALAVDGNYYTDTTIAAAIATAEGALADGDEFVATGEDVDYVGLYQIASGAAVEITRIAKPSQIDDVVSLIGAPLTDTQLAKYVPSRFVQRGAQVATPNTINVNPDGSFLHTGPGNTNVILTTPFTPAALAELAAGRDIRFLVKLESGSFSTVPQTDQAFASVGVLTNGYYEITLDAATWAGETSARIRWTASENSVVTGPILLFEGQAVIDADSIIMRAMQREWAREVAELTGNHSWGFYKASIEDLSGSADLIGQSGFSDHYRKLTAAGYARVRATSPCRGIIADGSYVTAVWRLSSAINDVKKAELSFSSNFSASGKAADYVSSKARMGDLFVQQDKVRLTDSLGDGRPVAMTFEVDNRAEASIGTAELGEVTAELLGVFVTDEPVPLHRFSGIEALLDACEAKLTREAVCDTTLATDVSQGQFASPLAAIRRGYGTVTLTGGQEFNDPGGAALLYPVHVRSRGRDLPIWGGWEELAPADFTDNGNGTFSYVTDHAYQLNVAGLIVVERKLAGAFDFYWPAASAAAVAGASGFAYFYDTASKTITLNNMDAGAVYRINASNQSSFIAAASKRRATLERVDIRYGHNVIFHYRGGVLATRGIRVGRGTYNAMQSEQGARWIDEWEDGSIAEYVHNDGWGLDSFTDDPVIWNGVSPGARHTGGDGFAPHGTYCMVNFSGAPWADDVGKMGFVSICPGDYRLGDFRCGANGTRTNGSGAIVLLAEPSTITAGRVEGDEFEFDAGVTGYIAELVHLPKVGTGSGGNTITNTGGVVIRQQTEIA
ncbi:hypothetical protein [Aurantiacibacter spongiae]|uniref:Uncharacterized protein n=1 Tax=Aurantiacibacter spongiae TaxID=2488860 RepID=A0A3N5CUZ4_9SPHN|nr:hypothetical protein [Aurantiacibacter spongiae]RPF70439.1 hypothetical protein EG799_01450 [Aurantiacibacter spongiae]